MIPGDVRHAWRSIVRMPVVATVVVVSLGVGIGVNTAVFSWVQAMYLQPLPGVAGAGRMYLVEPRSDTGSYPGASWLEYLDLQQRLTSLPDLFAYRMVAFNVGERGRVERTYGQFVSGNYFSALGLSPALGRFLRPDEAATAGGEPVAIVSYDYWQTRFNGSPEVLGRTIRVNELPLTIIGVAPRGFQGTVLMLKFDLWVPATLAPTLLAGSRELDDRSLRGYSVVGSLARSSTPAQSQAELDRTMSELANDVSGDERKCPRRGPAVLGRAPGSAADARHGAADAARVDAAAPARRVREYRQPDAGARELAPARGRDAARARRRTLAHRQPAADGECRARAVWRRAGRGDCGVGDGSDASGARHRQVPDQIPDEHRRDRARLRDGARGAVRSALRHRAGRPAGMDRPAGGAPRGCADGWPQRDAQYAHGGAGRSRSRRADGRRPVPAKLRRDA